MKKSKLDKCAYCGKTAESSDHVPSKCLLEKPYPNNLLTIPACIKCNTSFALDEEYLLNVLVEVCDNTTLKQKKREGGSVYKARQRSKGLNERIQQSFFNGEDGKEYFKYEDHRIKRVIEKIALGLYFHKYKKLLKLKDFNYTDFYSYTVEETRPAEVYMLTHSEKFVPKKWTIIQSYVFSYIIVKDWRRNNKLSMILHIHNSVWCIIEIPFPSSIKSKSIRISKNQLLLFN